MKPVNDLLETLSAPLGDLIAELGRGVADAQQALDEATLEQLRRIYQDDDEFLEQLRALGYQPTWYQIPEAEAELQVALSVEGAYTQGGRPRLRMLGAPLNASYQNRFDYSLNASSKLKVRIVPIPPPTLLEDKRMVPRLAGKTLAEARALLSVLDIPVTVTPEALAANEQARVESSVPAAGHLLDGGATLTLTVKNA
jgi:hypothetical protein